MELDRYRALVCAIETGSLSAAAERLQYTPSGISRMIAALEEENGFPLLKREHSGVRPTSECEALLPAIRKLLHEGERYRQLSAQIRGLEIGTITVGTAYSAFYAPLAKIISAFHEAHPGIQVQLCGGYSTELLPRKGFELLVQVLPEFLEQDISTFGARLCQDYTSVPSGFTTGMMEGASLPSFRALAARVWEVRAISSMTSRVML